ncbi:MAG: hypothetical protein ACTSRC_21860 [Candidatus Helarchaeota archaeon]
MIKDNKISVKKITDLVRKNAIMKDFNLHDGEAEAIVLFFEINADLLGTDDYRTIKTCKILKIDYFTTPSFIYLCFRDNKLTKESARLKLEKLGVIGWYKKDLIAYFKEKMNQRMD